MIWLHLSAAGGYQKVTAVSRHQSHVRIDYAGDIIIRLFSTVLAFRTTMSEKYKSTSPNAIQVKSQ